MSKEEEEEEEEEMLNSTDYDDDDDDNEGTRLVNRIESVRGNRNKVFQNIKSAAVKSISSP